VSLRPVVWAQEIQQKIEEACGVQTSHDGPDDGEDDEVLQTVVDSVLGGDEDTGQSRPAAANGASDRGRATEIGGGRGHPDTQDDGSEPEAEQSNRHSDEEGTPASALDAISQYAQDSQPTARMHRSEGTIVTSSGTIDVRLAPHFSFSDDDQEGEEEDAQHDEGGSQNNPIAVADGATTTTHTRQRSPGTSQPSTSRSSRESRSTAEDPPRNSRGTPQPPLTPSTRRVSTPVRAVGRPPRQALQHIATVASPDGPVLRRNPERATADEREEKENRTLKVTSNRLGGQDLRVLRYNGDALAQSMLNDNGKRSTVPNGNSEGAAGISTYAARKRIRMQQRLDEMQREMDEAENKRGNGSGEMLKMLMFFQKDSDRRAEIEERRRRSEREEREDADKKERAERERIRREEAEASDKRRLQELQFARELREEQRHLDAEREAKLEREKEENRRQAEERLALERSEARQRHEQMMIMLSALQKK